MPDDNQPQQPAGEDKPAESAPETPSDPAGKPPEPEGVKASPTPPADKPAAKPPAPETETAKPAPADAAPAVKDPAAGGEKAAPKAAADKPAAKPAVKKPPPKKKKPVVMETTPWEDELAGEIKAQFGDQVPELLEYREQKFLVVKPEALFAVMEFLKLESGFDYLVDLTAVDYPKKDERFEVIYILYSFARNMRVRVKTRLKDGEKVDSVVGVHLTANWLEREAYDMFGIEFEGHPDLKRILMPDDWEGFPLRKDSSIIGMDEQWVTENIGIDSAQ